MFVINTFIVLCFLLLILALLTKLAVEITPGSTKDLIRNIKKIDASYSNL